MLRAGDETGAEIVLVGVSVDVLTEICGEFCEAGNDDWKRSWDRGRCSSWSCRRRIE